MVQYSKNIRKNSNHTITSALPMPILSIPKIIKTSNEPNPPGTIDITPKTDAIIYKANISSILNFTPKTNPIYMKNRPAPAHSKQEPIIKK